MVLMSVHYIPKTQLIAAAESFAGVSRFADACYRYYFYQEKAARDYLHSVMASEFIEHLKSTPSKYHTKLIHTTLLEISYPIKGNAMSAFTAKERACCLGISRRQYYRHPFDASIDGMIGNIKGIALAGATKVQAQLGQNFKIGY